MAVIRLYRRFYKITSDGNLNSYSLIDPIEIIASSYIKDSINLIETVSEIQKESTGIYFVDLSPDLYSYSNTYDLKWTVQYTTSIKSSNKNLLTTFKLKPINISSEIGINLTDSDFSYDIKESDTIEVSIDEGIGVDLDNSGTINIDSPIIIEVDILKEI